MDEDDGTITGVEAEEVQPESTGRNVAIGVVGIVIVLAALIPISIGALYVGSLVYASVVAFLSGGAGTTPL